MAIVYRVFFFFLCCLPALLYAQSKHQTCHPVIRERNPCYLIPINTLNDTLIAFAGKYCTEFHFDSIRNGTVKVYSDDTTTLLQIATIKRGASIDSEYVFYENRQLRSLTDWKSGSYTSFHETGKAYKQGTITKGEYGYLFTGTETTFWDNGQIALKSVWQEGNIVESVYWNTNGDKISNQEFLDLWFKCK